MLHNPIGRLRLIGMAEGTSFLLLLGIAMPLKYLADQPDPVRYVGWVHGVLWMLYLLALVLAWRAARWGAGFSLIVLLASLVPFGPFLLDSHLRRQEHRLVTRQKD